MATSGGGQYSLSPREAVEALSVVAGSIYVFVSGRESATIPFASPETAKGCDKNRLFPNHLIA